MLILRRNLPVELLNEMVAALSLDKAFGLLKGMPNFELAEFIAKNI